VKIFAEAVIVIGEVNADSKPRPGLALTALYCAMTWPRTVASQSPAETCAPGAAKAAPRRSVGLSMDGSDL
jgi:hypothetical protein